MKNRRTRERPGARGIATAMHDSYQKLFEGRLKSSDDFITLKKYLLFYTNTHELPIKSSIDNKTHVGGVVKIVNNSRLIEQNILLGMISGGRIMTKTIILAQVRRTPGHFKNEAIRL